MIESLAGRGEAKESVRVSSEASEMGEGRRRRRRRKKRKRRNSGKSRETRRGRASIDSRRWVQRLQSTRC